MTSFKEGWYVVYTKPRHEKKVTIEFTKAQVEYYFPTTKCLKNWHDRKKYIEVPVFPSYIFTYLRTVRNYYDAIGANGVLYYLKIGKEIARVNERIVNNIKAVIGHGQDFEVSTDHFTPGQQLSIKEGPLTGITGEVVEVANKKKILVRVQLLQRSLLISMPATALCRNEYPAIN